ncbi:MAG TPA: histidine phosphatase family protein [Ilumatobacteraceae bacterium]|nr:histidine phosphatase family protein [Ilumatobacteraceae bacterium]
MTDATAEFPVTRLVLVRHGESVASANRSIGGPRTCAGLSDLGRAQCDRLAVRLTETGELAGAVLYASGYPRARETAERIAGALGGVPILSDDRWGEHDPGPDCDGLTFDEFIARHGMPDWESDPHAVTFPGGETIAELHHRVGQAVRDAVDAHPGATIVVCCHGGVVNAVLRMALRTPSTGGFELFTTNASLTELLLVAPGRWRLARYNDAAHLAGL